LAREAESSTLIAPGLAVPHAILDKPGQFHLVIARARNGIVFPREKEKPHAIFVLLRSKEERTLHLRALAAIAQIVQDPIFEAKWETATDSESLRHIVLAAERRRYAEAGRLRAGAPSSTVT